MLSDNIAIVVLAGELGGPLLLEGARAELIVCADGAAEQARSAGLECQAVVGDLDSISPDTLRFFRERGAEILSVPDQDHNDFEKALDYLLTKWSGDVHVYGMTGGRLDHALANLSIMLRYTGRFRSLLAFDSTSEYRFLTKDRDQCSMECPIGTRISLIPFGEAMGVVTKNLRYPLAMEMLRLGQREGLSNQATGSPVSISIEKGAMLVAVAL